LQCSCSWPARQSMSSSVRLTTSPGSQAQSCQQQLEWRSRACPRRCGAGKCLRIPTDGSGRKELRNLGQCPARTQGTQAARSAPTSPRSCKWRRNERKAVSMSLVRLGQKSRAWRCTKPMMSSPAVGVAEQAPTQSDPKVVADDGQVDLECRGSQSALHRQESLEPLFNTLPRA